MNKYSIHDKYTYDNGVLKNILNITNRNEAKNKEIEITKKNILTNLDKIWELNPLDENSISAIHKIVFKGWYTWAGEYRTIDISKGGFKFCNFNHIKTSSDKVFAGDLIEIIKDYVELNIIHHFREGNGRVLRLWLNLLLSKQNMGMVNWNNIAKDEYLAAMIKSPINDSHIHQLLISNLTPEKDPSLYFWRSFTKETLNQSYKYEGM